MAWTDERVAMLKKLWAEGHSASQIAQQLGGVTRNAVIGKVHRLGLSGRATPSRPVRRPPRLARAKPRLDTGGTARETAVTTSPAERTRASERAEILAALPPLQLDDGKTASVLTIRDSMCKWPIGDPGDPGFAFCGRKADCGPYCSEHAKIAFQPARKRDRRREEMDTLRRLAG